MIFLHAPARSPRFLCATATTIFASPPRCVKTARAMGTRLDRQSPAFALVNKGEAYRGPAALFGKRYITQYQPVTDASGTVVGILFVGVDRQTGRPDAR